MDSGHIAADVVSQQLQSVFVSLRQSVVLFARAFWGLGPLGSDKAKDSTGCFVFWGKAFFLFQHPSIRFNRNGSILLLS